MHRTTNRFWKCFEKLPEPVQKISKKNFQLLKTNPWHPSLRFKKVGKFWLARVGINHRALAVEDGEGGGDYRELKSKRYTTSLSGAPDGEYVVIQYKTSFENKKSAIETITPSLDKNGKWRVCGYYIK